MDRYAELSAEQRRQLIDAQQIYAAWRPVAHELDAMGSLTWNTSKGKRYLYQKVHGARKSLGPESGALHEQKTEHASRKTQLKQRVRQLENRLGQMAPVNRAIGIGRLPTIAARIVRELDREGLLGEHIIVAGTNALYAYETAAGVTIGGDYVATGDADLLWDTRRALLLAGTRIRKDGLMGLLRRVDSSFTADYGYNATNRDGYIVDLISPENEGVTRLREAGDLETTEMPGIEWLIDAPSFEQIIVGADGLPLRIVTPDPRTFALHKLWVSDRDDRSPVKKRRDRDHAILVRDLAQKYLKAPLLERAMAGLPQPLKTLIAPLKSA